MDESLRDALHKVYEGEVKAALRLKIFAKKADQEDLPQISKLFRVIAFSERALTVRYADRMRVWAHRWWREVSRKGFSLSVNTPAGRACLL